MIKWKEEKTVVPSDSSVPPTDSLSHELFEFINLGIVVWRV